MNPTTRKMTFIAMMMAMSLVLEVASSFYLPMPQGGSLSLGAIPLIPIGATYGMGYAMIGGIATGVLQGLFVTPYFVNPAQYFLDYILAFAVLGLGVMFLKPTKDTKYETPAIMVGVFVSMILRYLCHVISGVFFFAENAGDLAVWLYSFSYNATYMVPTAIVTMVVTPIVYQAGKRFHRQ